MFNVDANLFRACYLFTSTEETRYYRQGVSVEPHPEQGVVLAATDGHRALIAHDPDGTTDGRYIVQFDKAALAACKRSKAEEMNRRVVSTSPADSVWVQQADGEQIHLAKRWNVDGTFPDWRRVLPNRALADTPKHSAFDARYIASFCDVATLLDDGRSRKTGTAITIASGDPLAPALVRFFSTDQVFGVLMPMRGSNPVYPSFMDPGAFAKKPETAPAA
jgi:hypothetical protein